MIEVRNAQERDAKSIQSLIAALNAEVPQVVLEAPDLTDDTTLVLVATNTNKTIGFLTGWIDKTPEQNRRAIVHGVFVDPTQRRNGVGNKLVSQFSDWVLASGGDEASVEVPITAPAAQNFFQDNRFNVRSVKRVEIIQAGRDRYNINDEEHWYGVRCHFLFDADSPYSYEERITLWRADNAEQAFESAEREAKQYAAQSNGIQYLNSCDSYHLSDSGFAVEGKEVYSQVRESHLEPDDYLKHFFTTGKENTTRL